jgi:hypothetical protein
MAHSSVLLKGNKERRRTLNYFQSAPFHFAARPSIRHTSRAPGHAGCAFGHGQKLNPGKRLDIRKHYRFG